MALITIIKNKKIQRKSELKFIIYNKMYISAWVENNNKYEEMKEGHKYLLYFSINVYLQSTFIYTRTQIGSKPKF